MATFTTWGLSGTLVTEDPTDEQAALEVLRAWIDALERSCSRFREDSEIVSINEANGGTFIVSDTLARALNAARFCSVLTGGMCDPTILPSLEQLGYDRDYDEIATIVHNDRQKFHPSPGATSWEFDDDTRTLRVNPGTRLDLGASAKALLADAVLDEIAQHKGALVEIGGDVALRGTGPEGPWVIGLAASLEVHGNEPRVSLASGGIATSSTETRVWRAGERLVNHIIDPRTGDCAHGVYTVATVASVNCVTANALATASLLWDEDAGYYVAQNDSSARLLRRDGTIDYVGGWPKDDVS